MKVAALQLSTLKGESEIRIYLQTALEQKVKVILFGEYLLSPFFKKFENTKKSLLIDSIQSSNGQLIKISNSYALTIVTPMFEVVGNKIYKSIAIINKGKTLFYRAQKLMPYEHWNEVKFFANTIPKNIKIPPVFSMGGLKFSILFGYELHFDEFWLQFKAHQIDCVLLPSASTFDSSLRWRSIIKMRAFLNNCYILRANRIGQYQDEITQTLWNFYGDSLLVNPNGEVMDCLGDREELLIVSLDKKYLKQIKECWQFR
ncbi:MAG: carbon-nitrogen hydrolase family protein [Helicobacter sp.]|nr:carbon-nitrogen hydrolase family protein [Helicobacter sp.]